MQPRINEGRTYGGGSGFSHPPPSGLRSEGVSSNATGASNGVPERQAGAFANFNRSYDNRESAASQTDMSRRPQDPRKSASRNVNSVPPNAAPSDIHTKTSMQQSGSLGDPLVQQAGVQARPATSLSLSTQASRPGSAPGGTDRQAEGAGHGQVRGILKTRPEHVTHAASDLNARQNKAFEKAAETAASDPLAHQTVVVDGLLRPIKSLSRTLEALRAGKPWQQAFESKQASYLFNDAARAGNLFDEEAALKSIPLLSVYFPMSTKKEAWHNSAECNRVCNGAPHVDRAPTCRFCRAKIGQKYKETCLEHLQDCSGISKPEDRKLLYDAFRKADERLIQDSHTLVWNPGVKSAEVTQAKPVLAPRARPQTASTSVPMGRKTSAGSNPDAGRQSNKTGSNHRRGRTPQSPPPLPTYVPIAAKQLPNRIPTMPAAMRRDNPAPNAPTMQEAMRKSGPHTKDNNRQPPQDSSGPVSTAMSNPEDAGWGVSATSSTYAQHVAAEDSERDELDEPQHDPEDDFTWQAVREKLNNARVLNEQGSVARAQPNDEFFGAEIILEPRGAPSGQSFVPARHVSVPPSRPQSRAAYRGLDGEAGPETSAEGAADTSAEGISYIEPTAVPQLNERAAPIAEPAHAPKTSRRSPSSGDDMNLFRPASPPSTSQPRPDNQAICVSASQREPSYEAQDMPEPELPAEDPWDLVPEPGFESFFPAVGGGAKDSGSFNRPAAQVPLSAKEIETLVARGDTVERKSTRGGNIEQHISRQPSRASSLALSASDMDISDNSDFTAPSERTEKSIQQTAVAAAKPPGGCKSKSQSRKEKKRAKAARRADKKAAAVREELQELEQEQISHLRAQEEQHQGAFVRQGQGQQHVTGHETERVGKNGSQKEFKIDSQRGSPEKTKKTSGQNKAKGKAAPAERSAPRARSPSVECLNPIKAPSQTVKPKSQSQETSVVSDSTGSRHSQARSFDIEGDEDGDIPLRMLHSSPQGQVAASNVVEISSSSENEAENAKPPKSSSQKSTLAVKPKSSLGSVARKLTKKDREGASQLQTASRASAQNEESSLSDSDSDAPFVTSRRVDPSIFRPVPVVEIIQNASSRKPTSHAKPSSASSQHVPAKSKRAPTPSDPSESEAESESEVQESSARQAAAHARRFQRFAERDRSPEASSKRKSPGKKKTKTRADEGGATKRKPRIVRRQVEDLANDTSSPRLSKERKRKAKTIHTSDEEEEVPQGKRLKTYEEHQSQLMRQESVYSGQSSRDGSHISPVNNVHRSNDTMVNATTPSSYFSKDYAPFFVDVQKNVDNVLSLPSELDPWADIFEAADILNLDTLQDCIRKPENADEFVKWVLARTGRKMPLAKQFPMVQAIQQVLSHE